MTHDSWLRNCLLCSQILRNINLPYEDKNWSPNVSFPSKMNDLFWETFAVRSAVKWLVSLTSQCLHYFLPLMHFTRPRETRLAYSKWILTARKSKFYCKNFHLARGYILNLEIWILERYVPRYALMTWSIASKNVTMTIASVNVLVMRLFVSTVSF